MLVGDIIVNVDKRVQHDDPPLNVSRVIAEVQKVTDAFVQVLANDDAIDDEKFKTFMNILAVDIMLPIVDYNMLTHEKEVGTAAAPDEIPTFGDDDDAYETNESGLYSLYFPDHYDIDLLKTAFINTKFEQYFVDATKYSDSEFEALRRSDYKKYFQMVLGHDDQGVLTTLSQDSSILAALSYSVLNAVQDGEFFRVITDERRKAIKAQEVFNSEDTNSKLEMVMIEMSTTMLKRGLTLPFDIVKHKYKRGGIDGKEYYFNSETLSYYITLWSTKGMSDENRILTKKQIVAVINIHTTLLDVSKRVSKPAKKIRDLASKFMEDLYYASERGTDRANSVFHGADMREFIELVHSEKKGEEEEEEEEESEEEEEGEGEEEGGEEPEKKSPEKRKPVTPKAKIAPSELKKEMDEIRGIMISFISEIALGFKQVDSVKPAATGLEKNVNEFGNVDMVTFIAFLKLMKAEKSFITETNTKYGRTTRSLKYNEITLKRAIRLARTLDIKIGTYFNIDDEIVSIETNDDDGSLTIITKGGVRHHYDGKEVEKLYSSQHRFDEIVQSLKS